MKVEFCLPVKDEEAILEANVRRLLDWLHGRHLPFSWSIVIAINGSRDRSAVIAASLSALFPHSVSFFVLEEAGKGMALRQAFTHSQAEVMAFMDIDFAVDISATENLIWPIIRNEADLVIGSRLMPSSRVNRPVFRSLTSKIYNLLARLVVASPVHDLQCGFKAVSREAFAKIGPQLVDSKWFFDTELIIWAKKLGFRVQEIPVIWREHEYALRQSKVRVLHDSWLFLLALLSLRSRLRREKNIAVMD